MAAPATRGPLPTERRKRRSAADTDAGIRSSTSGRGLVTAGAVVGTGELIATPVLGAENGYSLLWLVILSCAIKVVVQNELGRYTIGTGETGLEALGSLSRAATAGIVGGLDVARHVHHDPDDAERHAGGPLGR